VTPFSQFVGSQALMNVLAEENGQDRYSRIPDEVVRFVLGHFGTPEGQIDPDVQTRVRDLPRAAELDRPVPEPSLDELRMLHSERLGRALADEDLLLAIGMPADQLDPMYAAGPAPRWVPASAGPPPTDVASFIAAAHTLPRWRSLRIAFGETRIALDRPAQEER